MLAHAHSPRFSYFVEQFPGAFAVFDRDLRYLAVSQRWRQDYGQNQSALVGDHLYSGFSELPDDWKNIHRRALAGESLSVDEDSWLRADGSRVWFRWNVSPWLTEEGTIGGIIIMSDDVTEQKQAELRLLLSDQALKSISQGVLIADAEQRIISVNEAFQAITGYSEAEMLGQNCRFLQGPLTNPATVKAIQKALFTPTGFTGEILNYRKDGSTFWNELTISPVTDVSGSGCFFVGVARDITARKETEIHQHVQRAQMEYVFESACFGMVMVDLAGGFLKANPSFCSLVGRTQEELLLTGFPAITHPDDVGKNLDLLQDVVQGRRESYQMEKRYFHKKGHSIWTQLTSSLVRNINGEPVCFLGQVQDITERKRDQQRILESEDRFRTAFAHAAVGMLLTDAGGRVLQVNEAYAKITGYSVAELFKLDLWCITHMDDHAETYRQVGQLISGHLSVIDAEKRLVRKDGEIIWVKTSVSLTRDENGNPVNVIALTEDITERRRAQAERDELLLSEHVARSEAERANRMKNEFLSTLSHELRTPLNAILGWVELLKTCGEEPGILEEGLGVIMRNVCAQATLIDDLLDMSRIESGQLRLSLKEMDLLPVMIAALATVRPALEEKEIQITHDFPKEPICLRGDQDRLQQVMWNFLTNAVKFTPQRGRVSVAVEKKSSHVEIRISDNGQGIRADFLDHVFDRFRQQDSTTTRRKGGLGIGLALVKELVEQHEGSVRVSSEGEGQGSTFTVSLPLLVRDVPSTARLKSDRTDPIPAQKHLPSLQKISVLVIDDEEDNREVVSRMLEKHGAKVLVADSAKEGFRIFQSERPDVILCDIGMPERDGYEFIQWVRLLEPREGGGTPAAALTAFARGEDKERAIQAGFQLHLVKPVGPEQLFAAVSDLLMPVCSEKGKS